MNLHSPEFMAWFGNSKATDEHGQPLLMYHGSPSNDIVVFKPGRASGIYFTPHKEYAMHYGANMYTAYLKIHKLGDLTIKSSAYKLMLKTFKANGGWAASDNAWEYMQEQGETDPFFNPVRDQYVWELFDTAETGVHDALLEAGYDGLKLLEWDGVKSWVVFSPEQVRFSENKCT